MNFQRYLPVVALVGAGLVGLQAANPHSPIQSFLSGSEPAQAEPQPTPQTPIAPSPQPTPSASPMTEPQTPIAKTQPMPSLPTAIVRQGVAANVRQAPSNQAIVLAVVMPGQSVQIRQDLPPVVANGITWTPIVSGEINGWMASGLIELQNNGDRASQL